jgi:hypothetical protein
MALGEDQPCSSSQSNEAAAPRELLMVAAAEVEVGAYVRERCSRQKELSSVGSRTRDHGESLHSLGARRARRDMKRPPAIWLVAFRAQNFKGCKPVASAPDQPHPNRRNAARPVPILRPAAAADETVPRDDRRDNNPFPLCRKTH